MLSELTLKDYLNTKKLCNALLFRSSSSLQCSVIIRGKSGHNLENKNIEKYVQKGVSP